MPTEQRVGKASTPTSRNDGMTRADGEASIAHPARFQFSHATKSNLAPPPQLNVRDATVLRRDLCGVSALPGAPPSPGLLATAAPPTSILSATSSRHTLHAQHAERRPQAVPEVAHLQGVHQDALVNLAVALRTSSDILGRLRTS
jgi:hypothetical protein